MKRILSFALALLLALALMPALAEDYVPEALYRIVLREETGDVTLGSGVLYGTKTTLLTAEGCWAEGNLVAIGKDGEIPVLSRSIVPDTHLILLHLAGESAAKPLDLTQASYLLDYMLYGVTADGAFVSMGLRGIRATVLNDQAEALLYAQEGLLPGAIMLGDDFNVAAITIWQEGEGEGAYASVAYLPAAQELSSTIGTDVWLLQNISARYEAGHVVVDWAEADGYAADANISYTAFLTCANNNYVSRIPAEAGQTTAYFPATPGTLAATWVVASRGGDSTQYYPQTAAEVVYVEVPQAEPIALNGLRNVRMGITVGAPGANTMPADFLPQVALTRENLTDRSRSVYFMTEDTYTCTAEDDEHTLMVTLYTPEGYTFHYYSGYVFMPEYAKSDLWLSDITELLTDYEMFCDGEPWPAGEYTFLYTIDGYEVSHVTFTLE